jgi:ankyrin repeat protein/Flp pilus assembly protein TadD
LAGAVSLIALVGGLRVRDGILKGRLFAAARDGRTAEVEVLLDAGASPATAPFGRNGPGSAGSALEAAIQHRNWAAAAALVRHGARPATDTDRMIILAAAAEADDPSLIVALVAHGQDRGEALQRAHAFGNTAAVRALLAGYPDLRDPARLGPMLWGAAAHANAPLVGALLDGGAPVDWADRHGATPLIYASDVGAADVARLLLAKGAAVDAADSQGATALLHAANEGSAGITRLLLAKGAVATRKDGAGRTAMQLAIVPSGPVSGAMGGTMASMAMGSGGAMFGAMPPVRWIFGRPQDRLEIIRLLHAAGAAVPDDRRSFTELTRIHADVGTQEAVAAWGRFRARYPTATDSYWSLAGLFEREGKPDLAVAEYRRCNALAPRDWNGHMALGRLLEGHGRKAEAAAEYREVVRIAPDRSDGYTSLGKTLDALGRPDDATAAYRGAAQHSSMDTGPWTTLGRALMNRGRAAEAIDAFRKVLALASGPIAKPAPMGGPMQRAGPGRAPRGGAAAPEPLQPFMRAGSPGFAQGMSGGGSMGPVAPVEAHYDLALALDQNKQRDEARKELNEYLKLSGRDSMHWPDQEQHVADARKRLQAWR